MDLGSRLSEWQKRIENKLHQLLPEANIQPSRLHEAMRYSVLGGGKRIRPIMMYSAGMMLQVPIDYLDIPASAIEMIHVYSLIHDDLPAMDDDHLRRGKPTCHIKFDEATAILAGDALQALAFYILSHQLSHDMKPEKQLALIRMISLASGSRGMAGGQAIDLEATGHSLDIAELENMHIHKTGELIRASLLTPTFFVNLDNEEIAALNHYAKCLGLAFQVKDDILDVTSDTATLGKQAGADADRLKATYPSLVGLKASEEILASLLEDGLKSLEIFGERAAPLIQLAKYIVNRTH
ncbi:MAG: geranyl transferase [Gammaproteobacteria bacterium]|nr:MAG: geranyl transferase [Gammaproteobacteria bacterium]